MRFVSRGDASDEFDLRGAKTKSCTFITVWVVFPLCFPHQTEPKVDFIFYFSFTFYIYIYNLEQLVLFSCLTIIFHSPKIQNYTYPPVAKTRLILSSLHLKTYNKIIQLRATGQQQLNDNCWRITVNEEIDRPFFVLLFFSAFENDV